jgi:hypothetical protein
MGIIGIGGIMGFGVIVSIVGIVGIAISLQRRVLLAPGALFCFL